MSLLSCNTPSLCVERAPGPKCCSTVSIKLSFLFGQHSETEQDKWLNTQTDQKLRSLTALGSYHAIKE